VTPEHVRLGWGQSLAWTTHRRCVNPPFCTGGLGTIGAIVPVGTVIQFEGSGLYTVKLSVGPPSGGATDCITGSGAASSIGSFTVDAPVAPAVFGRPMIFRAKPIAGARFVGRAHARSARR
jgi:hypothetical protein